MCAHNPWSAELFAPATPARAPIDVLRGDASDAVRALADGAFSCVIHDPPARALCKEGDLYGARFYGELRRVLKPGGTLFHYVGNPESKEGGRLFGGVRERLAQAGFASIATAKDMARHHRQGAVTRDRARGVSRERRGKSRAPCRAYGPGRITWGSAWARHSRFPLRRTPT